MEKILTVITGASGALYAKKFIEIINKLDKKQTIIISNPGKEVLKHELNDKFPRGNEEILSFIKAEWDLPRPNLLEIAAVDSFNSPVASGSNAADFMVVIPCTMGSAARFAQGISTNLIERTFDVMLKEKKKIIIVPRECPLNQIHLENLLKLSQLGVDIIPAMPAFYQKPESISDLGDFLVGRVLDHLGIKHSLYKKWNGSK
ncbi:4-hydroxy-3-polyprenylbenzoate decarboxylase [Halanaerobium saccharolyticum]|uniref:Flavin prenyltransferase UbiX n=1 Tax=Halanaerobium saccharolyticum TaxID=43595 RepID=A0A4R7ZBD0_9FIRM|nr:UbiX family flavin prenyltransferase [Halanaerobium saccharolyticum]RAK11712.1 4-hydroxy-3-polyprenylbenzoate decarboxylase [Halanaerobium saccharolyticum]TDW07553.1 4-hydroxy-3-polyprenylbenzoate decarboxylase [Halanaerobium saccharolyticum]TDX64474.1 4-hydroxy-3-polyprenylbenzoate decarboxylase [Halanaerobium saccharolyticum]